MNRRFLALAAAAAIAGLLPMSARAQYQISDRSRAGLSLSFMRPTDSKLRELGSVWLSPSLYVNLRFDDTDRATTSVGITWCGQEGGGGSANIIPVTATYVKRFGDNKESPWYVGGGLGAYWVNYKGWVGLTRQTDKDVKLGLHVVFGREFGGWYAELRREVVSSLERDNGQGSIGLGSWAITIGSRMAL